MYAVINEIFVGIGVNLGLTEKQAYSLSKNKPTDLQKGKFLDIFSKFKNIFSRKVSPFRIKTKIFNNGKPLSDDQWRVVNNSITDYWKNHTQKVTEEVVLKGHILGRKTTDYRTAGIKYTTKSLEQVLTEEKKNTRDFSDAYKNYNFKNSEKNVISRSLANVAMYVTKTEDDIKQAIRQNVNRGIADGKSPVQVTSDLYWNVKKSGDFSAERVRKNWARISATEMNSVFEAGILAPYEAEAMESLQDNGRAVYFVRTGGTCDWCKSRQGTLVRLVPLSIVTDSAIDSLSAMGIEDPNTDIAIWTGKNNVGFKQKQWRICCPAHPYNSATFSPIDIEKQYYSEKLGRVTHKVPKSLEKYNIPEADHTPTQAEIDYSKPTDIGDGKVRYNNNIYEAVSLQDYERKHEAYKNDRSLPIPVQNNTPQYRRIFESAK